MFTGRNNQSPCFGQQNQHTFLGGRNNNFHNPPYTMPPQSNTSFRTNPPCRRFQTSSPSCHWSGKGNRLNGKPAPTQPSNYYHPGPSSFFSGLRDCMNRFIPHNNFSSKFSQKPKNMRDYPVILPSLPLNATQPQPNIHTIIAVTSASPIMEAAVGAVMTSLFSADDFPALSTPKPVPSVKELWEEESKKREKKKSNSCRRTRKKNKKSAKQDTCDLQNDTDNGYIFIDFDCTKLHFISLSPPKHHHNTSNVPVDPRRPRMRQRQLSECSDDSFVVCFTDDCADGVLGISDEDSDDDDDSSETEGPDTDTESDEDEDTEVDEVDCAMKKTEHFGLATCDNLHQLDSGFDEPHIKKRVHFDVKPPKVHVMRVWSYAAQAARKGRWEEIGRDRVRFTNRIKHLEKILSPALEKNHRERIYKERFENCDNNQN